MAAETTGEIVQLAQAGGAAIVGAMATTAWQSTYTAVVDFFRRRRGDEEARAVEVQLGRAAEEVERAADREEARGMLAGAWTLQLQGVLRDSPQAQGELRGLLEQLGSPGRAARG